MSAETYSEPMNERRPVRLAIVNDYELVVVGVAALLEPFKDRIHIVELDSGLPVARGDVDVILYDTFGAVQGSAVDVDSLVDGSGAKVAIYSWNLHQELVSDSLRVGAAGYLSKGMEAEELVRAIEQIHAGQTVVPRSGGTVNPRTDSAWPGKVNTLVGDLRTDLKLGNVPFLAGELVYSGACSQHNTQVNKLPGLITNAFVVSAEGLALDPADTQYKLHFGHDAQVEFGKRYAAKMLEALAW